ncbi:uncharacterized protein KY384_003840 [Bacidia gigantensis]|uniref:uncharacterized protein n=1 Tax=Bacidia gigantensis TaxID=2732470 RepID=UPI001D04ED7F|nr:uncharacterized protein KY384_003840 [Bacidia gigantensis]KAG8532199.1 hypothetical protein KY384_003840 [Bacidia gigantensis]
MDSNVRQASLPPPPNSNAVSSVPRDYAGQASLLPPPPNSNAVSSVPRNNAGQDQNPLSTNNTADTPIQGDDAGDDQIGADEDLVFDLTQRLGVFQTQLIIAELKIRKLQENETKGRKDNDSLRLKLREVTDELQSLRDLTEQDHAKKSHTAESADSVDEIASLTQGFARLTPGSRQETTDLRQTHSGLRVWMEAAMALFNQRGIRARLPDEYYKICPPSNPAQIIGGADFSADEDFEDEMGKAIKKSRESQFLPQQEGEGFLAPSDTLLHAEDVDEGFEAEGDTRKNKQKLSAFQPLDNDPDPSDTPKEPTLNENLPPYSAEGSGVQPTTAPGTYGLFIQRFGDRIPQPVGPSEGNGDALARLSLTGFPSIAIAPVSSAQPDLQLGGIGFADALRAPPPEPEEPNTTTKPKLFSLTEANRRLDALVADEKRIQDEEEAQKAMQEQGAQAQEAPKVVATNFVSTHSLKRKYRGDSPEGRFSVKAPKPA